ncbi:MAG: DMSO/TMAO reductase YedYZ molybdopterin-dependent catalytic subunit [Cognaticolwellia sp.]|jgi:DMSO/TMAO reductase YedYZ molybdopterin-dependent catalytic subunit
MNNIIPKTPWIEKKPSSLRYYQEGVPSSVDLSKWTLNIFRPEQEKPIKINYNELRSITQRIENRRVVCVCNWSIRRTWTGIYLEDLFKYLKIKESQFKGKFLKQISIGTADKGKYDSTIRIDDAFERKTMLVFDVDGQPLSLEEGYPVRLIDFGLYRYKGIKGLSELHITNEFETGHWEKMAGYCKEGKVKPKRYRIVDLQEHRFIEGAEVTDF